VLTLHHVHCVIAVQRGQRDSFCVAAADLGPLSHVVVLKEGGGLAGDWHLQMVEVLHPGELLAESQ
jgi:hypothetical protein